MEENFGAYMKKLREERKFSVRQLAMKAGVSPAQVSRMETGDRGTPRPETIKKLAIALNVDYEHLMKKAGYITVEEAYETSELTEFLKKANIMFHGKPLTKEDKQRVEDVLTALFWHALEKRKKEGKENIGGKDGEEDNSDV